MKFRIFILSALALGMAACNQNTPQVSNPKILGILEVAINDSTIGATKFIPAKLGSQALINESEITFAPATSIGGTTILTESNAPRNFDYVSRIFTVTNKTGGTGTINNVTLVALAQTGNAGTNTALKTITNFNGNTVNATTAQAARPTHRMTGSGTVGVDTTEPYRASFQAFTSSEVTTMQGQLAALGYSGTVLEYGFVASSTGATASRTITDGASANVAIAMRFPAGGAVGGAYNFVMTFVVLEGGATRVTRSPEESTTNANTRAGNISTSPATTVTKVLIDDPAVITAPPSGFTVQNNVKIGTGAGQTLLKNAAKVVIARISPGGSTSGAVYTSDFVEIFNSGEFSATLNGKSLQYGALNGNFGTTTSALNVNTIDVSSLGIIAPGIYKLVSTPNQANATLTATPTTETTSSWIAAFNLATGGKISIVNQTASLDCGGNPAISPGVACTSTQSAKFIDLICYQRGNTSCTTSIAEGLPFDYTTITGDNVFSRAGKGCIDANNNKTDFAEEIITNSSARNSSTTPFICP
jgi:hypothetical protein